MRMSRLWSSLLITTLTCIAASGQCNVIDNILKDIEPCRTACSKIFTHNLSPNARHLECCKRGCRFFSLVEFINEGQEVNTTKDACMASCLEAYSQTGDRYACNIGCSNQAPFAQEHSKDHKTKLKDGNNKTVRPFMYVHNIYNNMVNKMSRIISVSWSYYLQQDDGKVVVVQSEPEIITEELDMDDNDYDQTPDDSDDNDDLSDAEMTSNDSQVPDVNQYHRQEELEPEEEVFESSQHIGVVSAPEGNTVSTTNKDGHVGLVVPPHSSGQGQDSTSGPNWLECFSKKSGLPRWFVAFTVILSAIIAIWICLNSELNSLVRGRTQVVVVHDGPNYHPSLTPSTSSKTTSELDSDDQLVSAMDDTLAKPKV